MTDARPNFYVLIHGLPAPDQECPLADGVTLRPLVSELSVFDLASAGVSGFREWALRRAGEGAIGYAVLYSEPSAATCARRRVPPILPPGLAGERRSQPRRLWKSLGGVRFQRTDRVAQLAEQRTFNPQVVGSMPTPVT